MNESRIKAVCMLSGGLDSALAADLVKQQGIELLAVNFVIPFGSMTELPGRTAAGAVAECLGIELRQVMLGDAYLDVVRNPRYGYGSNINPCIDCRIFMLKRAKETMETDGASFIVTGEVVGQRPMSQRLDTIRKIEKQSGLAGFIVRPLSAKVLAPSVPEIKGWVRREDFLALTGRSRKQLIALARARGIEGYSSPAGGCLLTDPNYALRVRDLLDYDGLTLRGIAFLNVGRHFRLPGRSKLVVGRNEAENNRLAALAAEGDVVLTTEDCPGPTAVLVGGAPAGDEAIAAGVVARYSDGRSTGSVGVRIEGLDGERVEDVTPMDTADVGNLMI